MQDDQKIADEEYAALDQENYKDNSGSFDNELMQEDSYNDDNNAFEQSDEAKAWGTKISIDGISYATSLFWQPLQNFEDPYTEVEEASEGVLEGADLFCIKQGKAPQFGICVSHEGYKSGEQVAAVSLSSALSDVSSFIAVFKVSNGWWYTCVRNDIILSDGDMLFLNEKEAKEQFMSMLAVPDWGYKIAPKEWGIEDTEYPNLEDLFQRGLTSKLQKIKALRGTKLLMVIGISAIVGLWLISSIIDAIFLSPPKRPVIAPVAPKVVQEVELPPEIKPWEELQDPKIVMFQCLRNTFDLMRIMPPGWNIGDITCTNAGVSTTWTRDVGRISWIDKALNNSGINFSGRMISDNGQELLASIPIEGMIQISSPPTRSDIDLKNTLNNMFQAIGQQVTLTSFSYTSPRGNIYRSVKFKFTSGNNPVVWHNLLTKFSGLEINMIKYSIGSDTWEYEGAIYVL